MRYNREHKEITGRKILDAASRGFRRQGFSGIGVDGIAREAGVTSGAFYAHFGSKDGAFEAALTLGLDQVIEAVPLYQREHGPRWVEAFAGYYLGGPHRSDLESVCTMAALTPDVVRSRPDAQALYEEKMTAIAKLMATGLAGKTEEDRLARAWAFLSTLIGGLNIALAMETKKSGDAIANAIKTSAIKIAGRTCVVKPAL